mmetsp:Transcript_29929/g.100858  ORF Transcript_29929/g.100858 Transcript_29929/m.100858 type:complete len:211 (-) Transcript_29929:1185-1817(-)
MPLLGRRARDVDDVCDPVPRRRSGARLQDELELDREARLDGSELPPYLVLRLLVRSARERLRVARGEGHRLAAERDVDSEVAAVAVDVDAAGAGPALAIERPAIRGDGLARHFGGRGEAGRARPLLDDSHLEAARRLDGGGGEVGLELVEVERIGFVSVIAGVNVDELGEAAVGFFLVFVAPDGCALLCGHVFEFYAAQNEVALRRDLLH